jgi:hypothetical protein
MPTLSMFYGLIIYMYAKDNQRHHLPLVKAWIIINQEDLMANWNLAVKGNTLFKIKPLT